MSALKSFLWKDFLTSLSNNCRMNICFILNLFRHNENVKLAMFEEVLLNFRLIVDTFFCDGSCIAVIKNLFSLHLNFPES